MNPHYDILNTQMIARSNVDRVRGIKYSCANSNLLQVSRNTDSDARFLWLDTRLFWLDTRLFRLDTRFLSLDTRFLSLDTRLFWLDTRLFRLDTRFLSLDTRIFWLDTRLFRLDTRFFDSILDTRRLGILNTNILRGNTFYPNTKLLNIGVVDIRVVRPKQQSRVLTSAASGVFREGGTLGHGPFWQQFFVTIGKNRKTWFGPFVWALVASKKLNPFICAAQSKPVCGPE